MARDDEYPVTARGVRTTVRIDLPDGGATEIAWDDSGQVTTTRHGIDGEGRTTTATAFDALGSYRMGEEPQDVERDTNPFGSAIERARYRDGTIVERAYDAEATLRRVRVSGPWGAQALELRPDGSRVLRWRVAGLHGERRWDAAGAGTSTVELAPHELDAHTWDF